MNLGGTVHITKTGCCVLVGSLIILIIYLLPYKEFGLSKSRTKINLNSLLSVVIQAAENGGTEVVDLIEKIEISNKGKTEEGADERVTTADFNSHCVMMGTIKKFFPTLNIISEEEVVCKGNLKESSVNVTLADFKDQYVYESDVNVWIDPLDATQEYTEKLTDFVTTMVCVAVNGKPVIGVIHKPFAKDTFWAWVGKGYSNNLVPRVPQGRDKFKFIVSRSHTGGVREKIESLFKDKAGKIVTAGGAGYKVLEVVNGNSDIYVHVTAIKKWDICAGNAVLNAVGGKMMTLHGREIDYADANHSKNEDGIIASTLLTLNIDYN